MVDKAYFDFHRQTIPKIRRRPQPKVNAITFLSDEKR